VKPRLAAFDEYIREVEGSLVGAAQKDEELVLAGGTL
jgi:threonine synthase